MKRFFQGRGASISLVAMGLAAMAALWISGAATAQDAKPAKTKDAALERTRGKVQMLDDILKTGIVVVHETYVHKDTDIPAAESFKPLFAALKAKGYAEARLVDATGAPYNDANAPADEFEKAAIAKLKGGAAYHDEVIERDGKRYLRAATAVPVVLKSCATCHDHFNDVPKGQAIGAIAYIVPVE